MLKNLFFIDCAKPVHKALKSCFFILVMNKKFCCCCHGIIFSSAIDHINFNFRFIWDVYRKWPTFFSSLLLVYPRRPSEPKKRRKKCWKFKGKLFEMDSKKRTVVSTLALYTHFFTSSSFIYAMACVYMYGCHVMEFIAWKTRVESKIGK